MEFARDNGCNSMMITGECEPQINREFLKTIAQVNSSLQKPFRVIEMQTTGVKINDGMLRFLKNTVGIKTISVSISDLWNDDNNADICQMPKGHEVCVEELCHDIKKYDFNLRLSINMLDNFENYLMSYDLELLNKIKGIPVSEWKRSEKAIMWTKIQQDIFDKAARLGANQITFRGMYTSGQNTPQDKWLSEHKTVLDWVMILGEYVKEQGRPLEILEYGATRYSVHGISTVVDDNCMATEAKPSLKYLILRPDCKLYSDWADKGSLLF